LRTQENLYMSEKLKQNAHKMQKLFSLYSCRSCDHK